MPGPPGNIVSPDSRYCPVNRQILPLVWPGVCMTSVSCSPQVSRSPSVKFLSGFMGSMALSYAWAASGAEREFLISSKAII